jgi:hypothetical protein
MRHLILLNLMLLVLASDALAAQAWPPSDPQAFLADVYASREQALAALRARVGDDATITEKDGKLTAKSDAANAPHELTVAFVDKPWAANWEAFSNDRANAKDHLIVAKSTSPCTSQSEAESAAQRDAANALLPIVRQRLIHEYSGRSIVSDQLLSELIDQDLRATPMIRDRFVQRFPRPYGDVWYQAILVDASPQYLEKIVHDGTRLAERRIQRGVGIVLAFLLLLAVTGLGYILLNWLTRGYFTWRLRLTAMTIVLVAIVLALAVHV